MSVKKITADELRSMRWFGPDDLRSFGHRSRVKQMGLQLDEFKGRPAFKFVKLQSHLFHTGTVSERPQVIRTKPAHAAQLICSYFFNGHGLREKLGSEKSECVLIF